MYFNKHVLEDRKEPIRSFTTIKNGWDRDLETGSSYCDCRVVICLIIFEILIYGIHIRFNSFLLPFRPFRPIWPAALA